MEDITPLNLEDQPKLFGLRYDQLITVLGSLIASTQLYSWMNPLPIMGGHDLRLDISILVFMVGPIYCLVTARSGGVSWETFINFYVTSSVLIPGPDPNPTRFLIDESLLEFNE